MYTIKQAAARSGVTVQLLRAWQRRYGVVEPARTPAGYRLYDEQAISRLRAMRQLVDEGWTPSNAAAELARLSDDDIGQIARRAQAATGRPGTPPAEDLAAAFVELAAELDEPGFEAVLDAMFARGTFERVADELVMPALVALGEGWASGRVDVAAEHAASSAVQRRLGMAYVAAAAPAAGGRLVLVGLPPGARHDLGALAFAIAARRGGMAVRYVGADLPVADWLEAVRSAAPAAVVIGVVMPDDARAARAVAEAVRRHSREVLVALGGRASDQVDLGDLTPAVRLPDELAAAVATLHDALGAG